MTDPLPPAETLPRQLIDVRQVAKQLGCSWRTVLRLADAGRIPRGVKLGSLRRWDQRQIDDFIDKGCKPVRSAPGCQPKSA
jgi:excisionase family DNA binding protein